MERVRLIYEQIEEAKKYILAGSLLQLRLALILLDNAVELMMYRELNEDFAFDDYRRPKYQPALEEWPKAGRGPKYSDDERRDAEKEFEPKARILQFRLNRMTADERDIICICHRMRCEAFHRGHLRREILLPVCKLLYATGVDLTVKLRPRSYVVPAPNADNEDTAFLDRFKMRNMALAFLSHEALNHLRRRLIDGIHCDVRELAEALSQDLVDRIVLTIEGLGYLGETEDEAKIDYNLQHGQFWQELGAELMGNGMRGEDLDRAFREWQAQGRAKLTLSKIKRWKKRASDIGGYKNPAWALVHFWAIDKRFAPLENDVSRAVVEYDDRINAEIHSRRLC
jgi:hypothetical protein